MTKETKTQWHPAFCSAMRLEFKEYAEYLEYTNEFNLTRKPLQIDLLIIKKVSQVSIDNEIGKLFKRHNIIEYKSPEDTMNEDVFLKVVAYTCLYKAEKEYADSVLQVVLSENREIFDIVKKEEREMCEALRELMAPEIREAEKKAMERGMEKGMQKGHTVGRQEGLSEGLSVGRKEERTANIQRTIARLQRMNESTKEILAALMDIFQLSEMEAKSYLK